MVMSEKPKFHSKMIKDGRWTVAVSTGYGPVSRVGNFATEEEANRWIATDSKNWTQPADKPKCPPNALGTPTRSPIRLSTLRSARVGPRSYARRTGDPPAVERGRKGGLICGMANAADATPCHHPQAPRRYRLRSLKRDPGGIRFAFPRLCPGFTSN